MQAGQVTRAPVRAFAISAGARNVPLLAAGWLLVTAILWDLPLNNDVSWQFWLARQLRHGFAFGTDVPEINPPLWFWEAMPLSALADRLGVAPTHLAVVATLARTALAIGLVGAFMPPRRRLLRCAGLAAALLGLPLLSFAERDHLAIIGALPYAALIAARAERRPVDARLALAIGLFAAWGFLLKPYFALPPLLLEAWLLARTRQWRPLRPELLALAGVAVLYAIAVVLFAPGYLAISVPLARAAYGDFAPPWVTLFTRQAWLPFWGFGGMALLLARPRRADTHAAIVLAAAFAGTYVLQSKGFPYHALPLTIALAWSLWLALCEQGRPVRAMAEHPLAALALACAGATAALLGSYRMPSLGSLERPVAALPPGTVFAVVSAHSWHFPVAEEHGFVWPIPGGIALMSLPAILRDPAHTATLRRTTLDMLWASLERCPAGAILVDDPAQSRLLPPGADYLAFLRSDSRFARLLDGYREAGRERGMRLLVHIGPTPRPTRCFS